MRRAAGTLALALALATTPVPALAAPRPTASPSVSPSPSRGSGRGTSPGVVLVFALLAAAVLWQVQRSRRSAQDYARAATDHFERSLERRPPGDAGDDGEGEPPTR